MRTTKQNKIQIDWNGKGGKSRKGEVWEWLNDQMNGWGDEETMDEQLALPVIVGQHLLSGGCCWYVGCCWSSSSIQHPATRIHRHSLSRNYNESVNTFYNIGKQSPDRIRDDHLLTLNSRSEEILRWIRVVSHSWHSICWCLICCLLLWFLEFFVPVAVVLWFLSLIINDIIIIERIKAICGDIWT